MSHLNLETLARLIDESPDPTEAGHLDICADCRAELEAMRADVSALHALPDPEPSAAQWIRLEQRLDREGLIRRSWHWQPALLRMAAAVVIFVLGGISATLVMRPRDTQYLTANDTLREPVRQPTQSMAAPAATLAENDITPAVEAAPRPLSANVEPQQPARTAQEAAARLRTAENDYLAALSRFAELSGRADQGDPLARLAALESIVATTRAALGNAPADPVINGYHMTAVAQRDALLRQVSASGQTWY
ncbi:MAG TPA: hypothetical protein VGD27_11895 [Longimicrobiales bacterium]